MEPIQFFSIGVLAICVIHLVSTAWEGIHTWRNRTVERNSLAQLTGRESGKPAGAFSEAPVQQRSDWYAFFHCADLVGREPLPKDASSAKQGKTAQQPKTRTSADKSQGQSRRPGIRLTVS